MQCKTSLFPFSWKSGRYKVAGDNTSNGRAASVGVVTNTFQRDHCFKQTGIINALSVPASILIVFLLSSSAYPLLAQSVTVAGVIVDQGNAPLPGAHVILEYFDRTVEKTQVTDISGSFTFKNVIPGNYTLKISFLGYKDFRKSVEVGYQAVDLGSLTVKESTIELTEVEVKEKIPMATQNSDTTEYNAEAFSTLPDASAEELISKMPGVVVDEGQVQAQGEDVKKVLVDGRPFFGNDPTAALRNLPAEVIDKIQIFDQQSDQAQFTGFDDGETTKTMNIVTRANMRNARFGKVYAGYGYEDKYQVGGNINIFDGNRRISLIGQSNNINIQNFATEDLLGVVGSSGRKGKGGFSGRGGRSGGGKGGGGRPQGSSKGGGRMGGGGASASDFLVRARGGISTTHAFGINYSDKWGEKMDISGSYFLNNSTNESIEELNREFLDVEGISEIYGENSTDNATNFNHRLNFKWEYKIDSANSIIMRPRASWQMNDGFSNTIGGTDVGDSPINSTFTNFESDLTGLDFSNNLLYRHRFKKPKRSFSINLSGGYNNKRGESWLDSENNYFLDATTSDTLDQFSNLTIKGWNAATNFMFTEPVGKNAMLMSNYRISYRQDDSDKMTYDYLIATQGYDQINDQLSNIFANDYITHQLGSGYNYRKDDLTISARASVQWAKLNSDESYPEMYELSQSFFNILPNVMIRYNLAEQKNIRIFYRTNTRLPSIEQLQDVVDNSNPIQITLGNPNLDQSFQHSLFVKYSQTNPAKSTVFFAMLGGSVSDNYIGSATYLPNSDHPIFDDYDIEQGVQIRRPVNLDGYWNVRSFITYGIPLKALKSNINLNLTGNYARIPGQIDEELNHSGNTTLGLGVVLSSNVSDKLDFTISSRSNYNVVNNTLRTAQNDTYFNQRSKVRFNWIFGKNFIFRTEASHQYYGGYSDTFDQQFLLWNLSIGKKLFANQRGELALAVFDLLNQNQSYRRNVTDIYIEDTQTNTLQRYAMIKFTYNMRHFVIQ